MRGGDAGPCNDIAPSAYAYTATSETGNNRRTTSAILTDIWSAERTLWNSAAISFVNSRYLALAGNSVALTNRWTLLRNGSRRIAMTRDNAMTKKYSSEILEPAKADTRR